MFISHNASRTGAPILLLNLLNLLKANLNEFTISIIIKNGFDDYHDILLKDFKEIGDTFVWNNKWQNKKAWLKNSFLKKKFNYNNNKLIRELLVKADFLFTNTLTNGDFFKYFGKTIIKPILCYVHELEVATISYTTPENLKVLLNSTNYFFSPSKSVRSHLVRNLGVTDEAIYPLNYYIPSNYQFTEYQNSSSTVFTVGIAGTLDWRKGADIIPTIICCLFTKYPSSNIHFVWKGADIKSLEYKRIIYELKELNYLEKILFSESSEQMDSFYKSIDLLLLPSKEDPYPLVVLEAASYKKPTICFDKAGGAVEFVEKNAGTIIPFLDISALVDELFSYSTDKNKCKERGNTAFIKYKERHLNESLIISQFLKGLNLKIIHEQ